MYVRPVSHLPLLAFGFVMPLLLGLRSVPPSLPARYVLQAFFRWSYFMGNIARI